MFMQVIQANLDHPSTQTLVPAVTSANKANVTQTAGCLSKLISSSGHTAGLHFPVLLAVSHGHLSSSQWDVTESDICHSDTWPTKHFMHVSHILVPFMLTWIEMILKETLDATCWKWVLNNFMGKGPPQQPVNSHNQDTNFYCLWNIIHFEVCYCSRYLSQTNPNFILESCIAVFFSPHYS